MSLKRFFLHINKRNNNDTLKQTNNKINKQNKDFLQYTNLSNFRRKKHTNEPFHLHDF